MQWHVCYNTLNPESLTKKKKRKENKLGGFRFGQQEPLESNLELQIEKKNRFYLKYQQT